MVIAFSALQGQRPKTRMVIAFFKTHKKTRPCRMPTRQTRKVKRHTSTRKPAWILTFQAL